SIISEQSTPTSTTTSSEKSASTLAKVVQKYDTEQLIKFLRRENDDLKLDKDDLEIIREEKITGRIFLNSTKQDFIDYGLKGGPAKSLADFAKEVKEKKLKSFSLCKTKQEVKEVFNKFGYGDADIISILPFKPEIVDIDSNDGKLKFCIDDIKQKIELYGPASELNKAEHCRVDYAVKVKNNTGNDELIAITEAKQSDVLMGFGQNVLQLTTFHHKNSKKRNAEEAFGKDAFDYLYGIVTTATNWYFILYTPERFYRIESEYSIRINKDALKDDSELRKDIKKVVQVLVSLLKDRVEVEESPDPNNLYLLGLNEDNKNDFLKELRKGSRESTIPLQTIIYLADC
ncbi:11433_t:CDS:2, partial [Gigaspora margarita]